MAGIPLTPYEGPRFSDIVGIARSNLEAQLAQEKLMVQAAADELRAQREEQNRERQHRQQMALFGLNEMKFNYDVSQNQPGGLEYMQTMAQIGQYDSAAKENEAQANYYRRRTENPEAFRSPGAAGRPRVIPLTAGQIKANADAAALGMPLPYPQQSIMPSTSSVGSINAEPPDYFGALGKTTAYGYANDETPDSNSSAGIGAWVPDDEAARIRRGEDSPYKLRPGDLAVSRDVEARLRESGFKPGDEVTFDKANGTTHTGRWMDRTADVYAGKKVTGRFDIYSPSGVPEDDGTPVTGFRRGGNTPEGTFAIPPVDAEPPADRQAAMPMDPLSQQRRQAMEYERIKEQSDAAKASRSMMDDAQLILDDDTAGPEAKKAAAIMKASAERDLANIFATAPKAQVVPESTGRNAKLNPTQNVSGQSMVLNPATGTLVPAGNSMSAPRENNSILVPAGNSMSAPRENNSILAQAEALREAVKPTGDEAINQQWTAAKSALLEGIGGRQAIVNALAAGDKIKSLPEMAERIRSILATKAKPTWYPGGSDFSEFSTAPLPPNAGTLYDVANALAEDLYKEVGSAVPANKSGVTITRTK